VRDDGKVPFDGKYLSRFHEWDAPQEATPPFRQMAKPIIVGVNGICCGAGMDLVTTGDIAIASEQAQFFDPHVSIGLVSGREMVRVARAVPVNVAMRMALLGRQERMTATRAYELGLITEIVAHDALADRLRELAEMVNRNAPLAVRGTRLAIRKGLGLPLYEAELLAEAYRERVLHTEDAREGPRAFMEKRPPEWRAE
jgi:enoyl-CoA hydratase/carnithine racemase